MKTMQLYKIMFACLFGTGITKRLPKATIRISCLLLSSIGLGYFIAQRLPAVDQPVLLSIALCTFIVQLTIGIVLMCAAGASMPTAYPIVRLLHTWPIPSTTLVYLSMLPGLLLSGICIGFLVPILRHLFQPLGIWVVSLGILIGCIGVLGMVYGTPGQKFIRIPVTVLGTLAIEYLLIRQMFTHASSPALNAAELILIVGLQIYLLTRCRQQLAKNLTYPSSHKRVRWANAPVRLWCFKKIGRSRSLRISLFTTVILVATVAGIMYKLQIAELSITGSVLALCVSALTADIRSITNKYRPVEIAGVRGCAYFFASQVKAGLSWSLLVGGPLLLLPFFVDNVLATTFLIEMLSPLALGFSAGFCTGTLVASGTKDISAQAMATIAAAAIYLLPQIPLLTDWNRSHIAWLRLGMASLLLSIAWLVEYHRNPFKWRKNNVAI
jgi:hypothetical protein